MLDVYQRASVFASLLHSFLAEGRLSAFDTLVIVGHCGTFQMLLARLLALDAEVAAKMTLPNCCVVPLDRFAVAGGYIYAASVDMPAVLQDQLGVDSSPAVVKAAAQKLADARHPGVLWFASSS